MALENFLDVNPVEDLVRGSGFQTVGTIASSSVNPLELLHGTIITFSNAYVALKQRARVEEFVLLQTANLSSGQSLQNKIVTVLLFNEEAITLSAGSEIVYKSGYDADDIITSFQIVANDWTQ